MPGIDIIRRNGASVSERLTAEDEKNIRRSAFESNLALQLEKALGGDASFREIERMTRAIGAAHRSTVHAVDARTTFRFDVRRYFVLQAGAAQQTGDHRLDALEPFAAKLLHRLPASAMAEIEPRLKAVGAAIAKAEIARRHPYDLRLRLNTPWFRVYLNVLSGRDRRANPNLVTNDRRAPASQSKGMLILLSIAAALSVLGAGLILATLWTLSSLLSESSGRDALNALLDSSTRNVTAFMSRIL